MKIFKKNVNKENLILDQLNLITSILSQDDLYKTLKDKINSSEQDANINFGWYQKEKDRVSLLEDINVKLESKISRLEQEIKFHEDNKENFNSLKKELEERLNKINRRERLLDDKQIALDTKLEEISKQQAQYVELLKVFHIKHDIRDSYQKTNEIVKEESINEITDEINS